MNRSLYNIDIIFVFNHRITGATRINKKAKVLSAALSDKDIVKYKVTSYLSFNNTKVACEEEQYPVVVLKP